jgi:hypothetical protein
VGIGTSSPSSKLDVVGTATISTDLNVGGAVKGNAGTRAISVGTAGSVTGGVQLWSTTTGTSYVQFGDEAGTAANHYRGYMSYAHANDSMALGTSGSTKVTIDSSGNVGIGTTSPVAPLNIRKDGAVSGGGWSTLLQATDENSNKGVTLGFDEASQTSIILATSSAAASDMAFWTYSGSAWGERMRIDSSGNVGIDVVPSADNFFTTLEIGNTGNGLVGRGPADTHFMSGLIWDGGSTQEYTVSSVAVGKYQITNGIHYWGTAPAGTAGTAATPQTNMILDASGNAWYWYYESAASDRFTVNQQDASNC